MSNGFDPAKMAARKPTQSSQPRAERLFMEVASYDTPPDGFHYAVGRLVGTDEQVRVRLTTVQERSADKPKISVEKIEGQYATDALHRDSIADKAKSNIRLMSFDDAIKLGKSEAGVQEYRAHWPKVMATDPDAELMSGKAHIKLVDALEPEGGKRVKAKAYIELLQASAAINKDNVEEVLFKALSIQDEQGRARDPIAIVRVFHDGKQAASVRLYPERETSQKFDQTLGRNKEISVKADAAKTIADLLVGTEGFSPDYTKAKDMVRAVIAGVKGEPEPVVMSQDAQSREDIRNYYYGAKEGALQVEVIAAEKIDFGLDSGKTYLNNKHLPHLAAYMIEETAANDMVKKYVGFTDTVLAVQRHPDGEPFAVFASPVALWPKDTMTKMADMPMESLPKLELPAELRSEAARESADPEPVAAAPAAVALAEEGQESRYDGDDGPGM